MKILLLGSASYKSSLTHFRLVAIGRQLSKLGWNVTMVVPSADKYNNFTPETHPVVEGVTVVQPWQPASKQMILNLVPYLFTALWAVIKRRSDIVYLYKPTPITIIGLVPKLIFRTPVIVDLDDLGSDVMKLEGQPTIMVNLVAWCERLAIRYASAVVVASSYLEGRVTKYYPRKPVLVLSNGVNPEEYPLLPKAKPRPALYYFGALNRLSIIQPLINALPEVIAKVPNVQVYILGGGAALEEAKAMADELGLMDHLVFSGWVDMQGFRKYIQFADIATCVQPDIPTVRAASNIKVFQYMALGTVPVVSDVGDLAAYVDAGSAQAVGEAVKPDDPRALAATLIRLLADTKHRNTMAINAHKRAESLYSWSHLVETALQPFLSTLVTPKERGKERA